MEILTVCPSAGLGAPALWTCYGGYVLHGELWGSVRHAFVPCKTCGVAPVPHTCSGTHTPIEKAQELYNTTWVFNIIVHEHACEYSCVRVLCVAVSACLHTLNTHACITRMRQVARESLHLRT